MQNFYKFYRLLLEDDRSWEGYYISRLGKNTFYNEFHSEENPLYSEEDALQDSQLVGKKFEEFGLTHKNKNLKLFKPVILMICRIIKSKKSKKEEISEEEIYKNLDYILSNLQIISNNSSLYTNEFIKDFSTWKFKDFKNYVEKIKKSKKFKLNIPVKNSKYKLIPIKSFEEFREQYGGNKTGYNGENSWCTANLKGSYNYYLKYSDNANFFILERNGWENITPPENLTDEDLKQHNPYDEYGLSLICLVIDIETLKLNAIVLRWNHLGDFDTAKTGISNGGKDLAFLSYDDISNKIGFDVKKELFKQIKIVKRFKEEEKLNKNKYYKFKGTFLEKLQMIAHDPPFIIFKDYIDEDKNKYEFEFKNLKIPDGIKEIDEYAFSQFKNIETIELPDSIEELGNNCFEKCINLKSIKLPINSNFKEIPSGCFESCINLKSIEIPNSIEELGNNCFEECRNLKSIKFPNNPSFKYIPRNCFYNCWNLESIEIPDSVERFYWHCFYSCVHLKSIKLSKNLKIISEDCFDTCKSLKSIEIPDSVEEFKNGGCFKNCYDLESIKLPINSKFKEIPYECFKNCINLKSIEIPDSVNFLDQCCFEKCISLISIKLPNNLEVIPPDGFYLCRNLKFIKIPDSVKELDNYCFSYCKNLESIKLSKNLKNISYSCFSGCANLKEIEIPQFVEEIGSYCFNGCSSLERVVILGKISSIGFKPFDKCSSLKEIICKEESTYNKFKELNLKNVKIIKQENI